MTDLNAIVFAPEMSPNGEGKNPRSTVRSYAFETNATLEQVLTPGFLTATELGYAQVGETVEVRGADFIRVFRIIGKQGYVELELIGTEDGPGLPHGLASIAPGEVHTSVQLEEGVITAAKLQITPLKFSEPFEVTPTEQGFDIDIETSCTEDVLFNWVVLP